MWLALIEALEIRIQKHGDYGEEMETEPIIFTWEMVGTSASSTEI